MQATSRAGDPVPEWWRKDEHYSSDASNTFFLGELTVVKRSEQGRKFAEVLRISDGRYDVIVDWAKGQEKIGCEPQHLGKIFPSVLPQARHQYGHNNNGPNASQAHDHRISALEEVESRRTRAETEVREVILHPSISQHPVSASVASEFVTSI